MGLFLINDTKITDHFQETLRSIRTGRVNASILDSVLVEAYGTQMSIKELATVQSPEPAQLLITPFDKSVNQAIEKAIVLANLGAQPVNDGAGIRLNFPPLTEETRKNKAKEVDKHLEEAKIQVRLARQHALDGVKDLKTKGEMGEDDFKRAEVELQKEVDSLNKKLEEIASSKKEELLKM